MNYSILEQQIKDSFLVLSTARQLIIDGYQTDENKIAAEVITRTQEVQKKLDIATAALKTLGYNSDGTPVA